jgi:hypothetical protein
VPHCLDAPSAWRSLAVLRRSPRSAPALPDDEISYRSQHFIYEESACRPMKAAA